MKMIRLLAPESYSFRNVVQTLAYNAMASRINLYLADMNPQDAAAIDMERVANDLKNLAQNGHNLSIEDMRNMADDLIDDIRRCEYDQLKKPLN